MTDQMNVSNSALEPALIIPPLEEAVVKTIEDGGRDRQTDLYWQWVQQSNHQAETELGFHLERASSTTTMTIRPDTTIRARVGLQAFIANNTEAITYGWKEVSFRFNDYPKEDDADGAEQSLQVSMHCILTLLLFLSILTQ